MALKPGQGRNPVGENPMAYNTNRKPNHPPAPPAPPAPPTSDPPASEEGDSLGRRILLASGKTALVIGTGAAIQTTRTLVSERAAVIGSGVLAAAALVAEIAAPGSATSSLLSPAGNVALGAGVAMPLTQLILEKSGLAKPKNELTAEEMRRQIRLVQSSRQNAYAPAPATQEEEWERVPAPLNTAARS